jgi:hypothetical protein
VIFVWISIFFILIWGIRQKKQKKFFLDFLDIPYISSEFKASDYKFVQFDRIRSCFECVQAAVKNENLEILEQFFEMNCMRSIQVDWAFIVTKNKILPGT